MVDTFLKTEFFSFEKNQVLVRFGPRKFAVVFVTSRLRGLGTLRNSIINETRYRYK